MRTAPAARLAPSTSSSGEVIGDHFCLPSIASSKTAAAIPRRRSSLPEESMVKSRLTLLTKGLKLRLNSQTGCPPTVP